MKKIFLLLNLIFITTIYGAVISGNQGQVSIEGGSMSVTSAGKTVTVSSGEITFTKEGSAPTAPRAITPQDLQSFNESMEGGSSDKLVNIKYPTNLNKNLIKHLRLELIQKGIPQDSISIRSIKNGTEVRINEVEIEKIKSLYPPYYKLVEKYHKNKKSSNKVPTITIKNSHLKRFHKELYLRYDR